MSNMYFFLGFHRTGSTFLQNHIFGAYDEKIVVATPYNDLNVLTSDLYAPGDYGPSRQKAWWDRLLEAAATRPENAPVIISQEGLSSVQAQELGAPERIAKLCPGAKVAVCLRSHYTMLPSLYGNRLRKNEYAPYEDFIDAEAASSHLDYLAFVTRLKGLFGREHVKVLFFEDLVRDNVAYVREVTDFCGLSPLDDEYILNATSGDRNAEMSPWETRVRMAVYARLRSRSLRRLAVSVGKRLPCSAGDLVDDPAGRERIQRLWASMNRQLAEHLGRDLGALGYPV